MFTLTTIITSGYLLNLLSGSDGSGSRDNKKKKIRAPRSALRGAELLISVSLNLLDFI